MAIKKQLQHFMMVAVVICRWMTSFLLILCDPKHRVSKKELGQDPDWLIQRYAWMMDEAIRDRPSNMIISMHIYRGNFRSTHAAEISSLELQSAERL